MFLHVSICPQGEYLGRYPLLGRYTPLGRYPRQVHPPGQVHPQACTPPGQVPPWQVHPPGQVTPGQVHSWQVHPLAGTPPGRYIPLGWYNPPGRYAPPPRVQFWGVLVFHNFSERQILWSLCLVDFHTFTLQLPIHSVSLHSVAHELQVSVSSLGNCQNFSKTSTPLAELAELSI